MTEKEKCAQGLLYYPLYDEQLAKERAGCKDLCTDYNQTKSSDIDRRNQLIRQIITHAKSTLLIEPSFWCDYGYNIEIGDNFYSNHNLVILDCAKVIFGDNVLIGPNCGFYTAGHPIDVEQRNAGLEYARPIRVGNNVWFGGNAAVMPGVTIGDNSVIGAGSIVTKDIPANVIAVGNPCKVLKEVNT